MHTFYRHLLTSCSTALLLSAPFTTHALQYDTTYDVFFMNIDDPEDPNDNDGLRFGGTLNKFL